EQQHQDYAETLALAIENHIYLSLWNQPIPATPQYKNRARGIGLNLPKNRLLQAQFMKGEVTPQKLVNMSTEEMASEEFQLLAEQVRRESEKQNTIVSEDTGPRIRRTHKGEELVGEYLERNVDHDGPLYSGAPTSSATNPVIDEGKSGHTSPS